MPRASPLKVLGHCHHGSPVTTLFTAVTYYLLKYFVNLRDVIKEYPVDRLKFFY